MEKTQVYNSVCDVRKKGNVSQEDLAQKVGVSRQTIIALEKGNYTPSVLLALKIAEYFKVRVEDVFHLHDIKN